MNPKNKSSQDETCNTNPSVEWSSLTDAEKARILLGNTTRLEDTEAFRNEYVSLEQPINF